MTEGLIVMFLWGLGSFIQSKIAKEIGTLKMLFIANLLTLTTTLLLLFFYEININWITFLLLFFSGLFLVLGIYSFYKGVEIGEISVVAPISGAYSIITVMLSVIFLNETVSAMKWMAIIIMLLGISLISIDFGKLGKSKKGLREAFLSMFFQGFAFFILGMATKGIAFFGYKAMITDVYTVFIISALINTMFFYLLIFSQKGVPKKKDFSIRTVVVLGLTSIIFMAAWIIFNLGLKKSSLTLHVPISSLSPMITVLLAVLFMKEKLRFSQIIGIVVTMVGVFLIGL